MASRIAAFLSSFLLLACDRGAQPPTAEVKAPATDAAAVEAAAGDEAGAPSSIAESAVAGGDAKPEADKPAARRGLAATVDAAASEARSQAQAAEEAKVVAPASAIVDPRWPAGTPILKVGSTEILASAVMNIYALKVEKYTERGRSIPESAARRYRKSITERIAYNEMLRQEAVRLGVDYDKAALTKREKQQREGIRDWTKHLARRGETEDSLRAMYRAELREQAILEREGVLALTPSEIAEDYEKIRANWKASKPRVRASHILISIDGSEVDAKKAADDAYAQATTPGADFGELARRLSSGPSAAKGGDIGIFTRDRMVEEFSDAAFAAKPGTITKPVKTKFGFHVIKVIGRWPAGELPLSALEDQIRDRLRQRKLHQGRRELKVKLMKSSGATTWLDYETGARLATPALVDVSS